MLPALMNNIYGKNYYMQLSIIVLIIREDLKQQKEILNWR